ncbi:rab3 GTPase-activating protein catalytic subunit [Quillaja saponaria]|uniref:Rab3 GTPase-activating protein catalytic subunit n=1 Tax=Quillaja saponaria TaxID=32244 RepID=A0AAD7PMA4_QUISA|nr:rab3 GTPase-activating protein catalytic subunit [Quillaja saponaria]
MEPPSFVSKAKTAFHSAAAKAERVLLDFKSDRVEDPDQHSLKNLARKVQVESPKNEGEPKVYNEPKHFKWKPPQIGTKQDWQDRFKNIRIGRKEVEDTDKVVTTAMAVPFYDENLILLNMKNDHDAKVLEAIPSVEGLAAATTDHIPPSSVLKQLAIAVEAARKSNSMKDFLASPGASSPLRERAGLSLSAVKSLVLRENDDKLASEFCDNEKVLSLIQSLFDTDGKFLRRNISSGSEVPRDIHGAPPDSLFVKLAEVIGNFKTLRKMSLFWCRVVVELRKFWSEEQYIPGIPLDENPDLKSCLLYQQLQVINCCISRKRRRVIATESLDSVLIKAALGKLFCRLGVDCPSGNLTMLETGEPVYSPVAQEGPLLTEDLIKETEEFVLRTGSVGAGCSQLLSDMQAFKAANPGCILEDFVRWHSPPDWTEGEPSTKARESFDGGTKGQLSTRMQKEGNLWRELWETAKPVPAVKQAPLFDEDLAVEGILNSFEDIQPSELFEQLFVSLLGLGFAMAEPMVSGNIDFSKLFYDCKDYIVATCQGGSWSEKIDDLLQVYETVETMLLNPDEVLKMVKQPEESTATTAEPKRKIKRLSLIFGVKDRHSRKPVSKDQNQINTDENSSRQPFASFFDSKSSLFSKKPPKPESTTAAEKPPCSDGSDWTIV